MPDVLVVIPTLDRPDVLAASLRDVVEQLPRGGAVLVVDQSDEATLAANAATIAALGDGRVRHRIVRTRGLPNARNVAIGEADAPIVVFIDDDVRLMPGWLAAHVSAYRSPVVGGVVGRVVEMVNRPNRREIVNDISPGGRILCNLDGVERAPIATLAGRNMSFRREALARIVGFDRNYLGTALLEDADASARAAAAGFELWFEPEAALLHLSAPRGGVRQPDPLRTERWRFRNTAYFMRRHRGDRSWTRLRATFTTIALSKAAKWRDPEAVATLTRALHEGWEAAAGAPDLGSSE